MLLRHQLLGMAVSVISDAEKAEGSIGCSTD
jgi:hypothetical protein